MGGLQALFLASPPLAGRQFPAKSLHRRRLAPARHIVSVAREMDDARNRGRRIVDEDMVVLRMRIRDMEREDPGSMPPLDWWKWEKKYYPQYNEDVCEAVGLLQWALMNTRPCVALGMVALAALSVPISAFAVILLISSKLM